MVCEWNFSLAVRLGLPLLSHKPGTKQDCIIALVYETASEI